MANGSAAAANRWPKSVLTAEPADYLTIALYFVVCFAITWSLILA